MASAVCPLKFPRSDDPALLEENFAEAILVRLSKHPHKVSYICPYTDRRFKGSEVISLIQIVAQNLLNLGLKKGQIVVFHALTTPFSHILIGGIILAGGIYTGISRHATTYELEYVLKDTDSQFLILSDIFYQEFCQNSRLRLDGKRIFIFPEELNGRFLELLEIDLPENSALKFFAKCDTQLQLPQIKGSDIAFLPYSSGTTGTPKGVLASHSMLIHAILGQVCQTGMCYSEGNIVINISPLTHPSGFNFVWNAVANGATVIMLKSFEPQFYGQLINRYKCDHVMAVPSMLVSLLKDPTVRKMNLSTVKHIFFGSSPCAHSVMKKLPDIFPNLERMKQIYGMTEIGLICTTPNIRLGQFPIESIGLPCPGVEMKIVDSQTHVSLPPLAQGEIWVKSPLTTMSGYFRDPQKTCETVMEDGWVRTGDIGYYDGAGRFYVTDRLKELIKYRSYQIAPAELENLLIRHSSVKEVAVTGIPAPNSGDGEVPIAFVVLKEGIPPTPQLASEIANCVSTTAAHYKRLRGGVHFVRELPKTPSGKVMRRLLRSKL